MNKNIIDIVDKILWEKQGESFVSVNTHGIKHIMNINVRTGVWYDILYRTLTDEDCYTMFMFKPTEYPQKLYTTSETLNALRLLKTAF